MSGAPSESDPREPLDIDVAEVDPWGPAKLVARQLVLLAPVAVLWIAVYLRGSWHLAGLPMLTGYHWMVPLAAGLSASWVARVLGLLEDSQPYLRPSKVRLDEAGIVIAGGRLPWSAVRGCAVLHNRRGWRVALETTQGARAIYPRRGEGKEHLAWLAERIEERRGKTT